MVSNTLIFTGLPGGDQYSPACDAIQALIQKTDIVPVYWTLLKSFKRILAVFSKAENAVNVKTTVEAALRSHSPFDKAIQIRLSFGQNTPIEPDNNNKLKLPDAGRLWLLSPPPSPPVGWEPKEELKPNRETHFHADELQIALEKNLEKNDYNEMTWNLPLKNGSISKSTILLESVPLVIDTQIQRDDGIPSPLSTPSIILETEDDEDIVTQEDSDQKVLPKTEMPPI